MDVAKHGLANLLGLLAGQPRRNRGLGERQGQLDQLSLEGERSSAFAIGVSSEPPFEHARELAGVSIGDCESRAVVADADDDDRRARGLWSRRRSESTEKRERLQVDADSLIPAFLQAATCGR